MIFLPHQEQALKDFKRLSQAGAVYALSVLTMSVVHTPREVAAGPPAAAMGGDHRGEIQPRGSSRASR